MFCRFRTLLTYTLPLILLVGVLLGVPQVTFAADWFANTVWNVVVSFFGLLAGLSSMLLNFAVTEYVVGFGNHFTKSGIGEVTAALWTIVRDIFNITFIFGLVYIGFKMILDSGNTDTRRWLASLILAALLVNFSLFITKFVVEISNQLSAQIVTAGFDFEDGRYLIADAFMNNLGVTGLFELGSIDKSIESPWGYIFGTAILLLVMTFVFAAGAILLVVRYAVLIIYMILSPLMFLGSVFPQMRSYTSQYWRGFLGRAFFAPIYLLLIYFSLAVITAFYKVGDDPAFGAALKGGQDSYWKFDQTLPPFILSVVFLIASLVIANKLGAQGASTALSVGKNLRQRGTRMVGTMTAGTMARGGRKLIGGVSNSAAESKNVQKWARRGGFAGIVGRGIADTAHLGRTSSFDVRNVAGLGKATGTGEGKKGGYEADQKAHEKKEQERAKRYSTQEDERFYEDAGEEVMEAKERYGNIVSNLNETLGDLANATDQGERDDLNEKLDVLRKKKEGMEKGIATDEKGEVATLNGEVVEDRGASAYLEIKKNQEKLQQESYASNLERRGEWAGKLQGIFADTQSNRRSAASIRRNVGRGKTEKLLERYLKNPDSEPSNNDSNT